MKIFAALILAQFWMFPELLTINFANALTIIADLLCPKVVIQRSDTFDILWITDKLGQSFDKFRSNNDVVSGIH